MHSLTLLYDFGETKVQQRNFIAKGNKRKNRILQVRHNISVFFSGVSEDLTKFDLCNSYYPPKKSIRKKICWDIA